MINVPHLLFCGAAPVQLCWSCPLSCFCPLPASGPALQPLSLHGYSLAQLHQRGTGQFHVPLHKCFIIPRSRTQTEDTISVVLLAAESLLSTEFWCEIKILPIPTSLLPPPSVQPPPQIPEEPLGTVAEVTGGGAVLLHQLPALLTEAFFGPRWAHK